VASQVQHLSITIVCGRVLSGNGSAQPAQPGAMADASNVRSIRTSAAPAAPRCSWRQAGRLHWIAAWNDNPKPFT